MWRENKERLSGSGRRRGVQAALPSPGRSASRSTATKVSSEQEGYGSGPAPLATRSGRAGQEPRAEALTVIMVIDGGATSAPAAGLSLSLLRGGAAPQACRRLTAPSSTRQGPVAACRRLRPFKRRRSPSQPPAQWMLTEAGPPERFTDRIGKTTSCSPLPPRGDLAAGTERGLQGCGPAQRAANGQWLSPSRGVPRKTETPKSSCLSDKAQRSASS